MNGMPVSDEAAAVPPSAPSDKRPPILVEAFQLYFRHGWTLTRPILLPLLMIAVGVYGTIAAERMLVDAFDAYLFDLRDAHPWVPWVAFCVVMALTLPPLLIGFWQFIVYWASLNINAVELMEGRKPDIKAAYQTVARQKGPYGLLWFWYCVAPLGALVPLIVAAVIGMQFVGENMALAFGLGMAGLAVTGVMSLGLALAYLFASLVFQVAAFEGSAAGPWWVFQRSARLVWGNTWRTLGLQVVFYIVTNLLVPVPVVLLAHWTHADEPLNMFHRWILGNLIAGQMVLGDPSTQQAFALLASYMDTLVRLITESMISMGVVALMLPLGTFGFARLYTDIIRRRSA